MKPVRFFCLFLLVLNAAAVGCARRPAPVDSNANQPASNQAQPGDQQTPQPSLNNNSVAGIGSNQQPGSPQSSPPAEPPKIRVPSFVDQAKGGVKDVPNYPRMNVVNTFYGPGPQPGYDSMRIIGQT